MTGIVTALAMWYMFREMSKVKPEVIYARRKERLVSSTLWHRSRADFNLIAKRRWLVAKLRLTRTLVSQCQAPLSASTPRRQISLCPTDRLLISNGTNKVVLWDTPKTRGSRIRISWHPNPRLHTQYLDRIRNAHRRSEQRAAEASTFMDRGIQRMKGKAWCTLAVVKMRTH